MKTLNNEYMAEMSMEEMSRTDGGGIDRLLKWIAIADFILDAISGFREGWNESVIETGGKWK